MLWSVIPLSPCRRLASVGAAAALASAPALAAGGSTDAPSGRLGPEAECRVEDGRLFGPWRQSARPLVACYTGPYAQRHPGFVEAAQRAARVVGGRYLEIRKEDLRPSSNDENGALLYPDGVARVMLLLMPGGHAAYSMADLAGISDPIDPKAMVAEREKFEEMRKNPRTAFERGMNYLGACGGFFAACSGYTMPRSLHTGWGLWPGKVDDLGPAHRPPFPDVVFDDAPSDHPLVRAAGGRLRQMYYHGGPMGVQEGVEGTEYLGRYRGGNMPEIEGDWFLVAYRPVDRPMNGRCVIATGHPEANHREFLTAMALYAMDHEMETPCRSLRTGESVEATIGDEQMHYYLLDAPAGGWVRLALAGLSENCDLYVRRERPPTTWRYDFKSASSGIVSDSIAFVAAMPGPYFVAVHGAHDCLNGVRYTLAVGPP